MPTLTFQQIEQLWTNEGGNPGWAPLMAAIAEAESGGNTTSLNNTPATGDYSVGLWQINYYGDLAPSRTASYGTPESLQASPVQQALAAINLSNNGANLLPWRTDAAWNAWQAQGAPATPSESTALGYVGSQGNAPGSQANLSAALTGTAPSTLTSVGSDIANAIGDAGLAGLAPGNPVSGAIGSAGTAAQNAVTSGITAVLGAVEPWFVRVGLVILGLVVLLVAFVILSHGSDSEGASEGAAAGAVGRGAREAPAAVEDVAAAA